MNLEQARERQFKCQMCQAPLEKWRKTQYVCNNAECLNARRNVAYRKKLKKRRRK